MTNQEKAIESVMSELHYIDVKNPDLKYMRYSKFVDYLEYATKKLVFSCNSSDARDPYRVLCEIAASAISALERLEVERNA